MTTKIFNAPTVCLIGVLLACTAQSASADTISFSLGTGNAAISGFAGPYATAQVNRTDATHAIITFTSLLAGGNIYLLGDGGSVAVNVNATSWTLGTISGSNAGIGFTPGPYSDGGAANEDGFGSFNQTIDSFDGFTHSSDTLSLALTNTSGTWSNAASVLIGNALGYSVGAHIFITSSPANAANGAIVTGFAADLVSTDTDVPEPGTLALLGLGLAALGLARRHRLS